MKEFLLTHKLSEKGNIESVAHSEHSIPDEVKTVFLQTNTNSYANGFFKFISPDTFRHYFPMWNLNPADCFPFIKCAFGHLVFYHQSQYKVLNPIYNCIDVLGEEGGLDFVMNIMLCDRQGLENSFFIDVYELVFEKLGSPKLNEIYAFIPAIGLGGSRDPSCVQKVQMNEQMMILSQL